MNADQRIPDEGLPPVFPSGLALGELDLAGGAGFWEEVNRFSSQATLDEVLDQASGGKSVPRVWVIIDDPENTAARTAAAMALARVMSDRDQKVMVLDADDQHPDLTRWSGRSEQEGWIDFIRYGASASSCCHPLPWEGRSAVFMGVGSFWPTEIEPAEVEKLVSRLRRQVDDLIITVPLDPSGLVWARHASICLVCWDRLLRSTSDMQAQVHRLFEEGIPVAGIIGFGLDEAEILDSVLEPVSDLAESAPAAAIEAGTRADEDTAASSRPQTSGASEGSTPAGVIGKSAPAQPGGRDRRAKAESGSDPAGVNFARRPAMRKGTSPIFWGAAGLLVVVCVAIVILWVRMQNLPDTEREPGLAQTTPATDIDRSAVESPGGETSEDQLQASLSPGTAIRDPGADSLTGQKEPGTTGDSSRLAVADGLEPAVVDDLDRGTAATEDERDAPAAQPAAQPSPPEPTPPVKQEESSAATETPYNVAVGRDGWAIHLYSLPDEASTVDEAARLERKGYRAAWRIEDVPGKGRYYRVYVGSFSSKAAASKALPELKDRLRLKWAQVREY